MAATERSRMGTTSPGSQRQPSGTARPPAPSPVGDRAAAPVDAGRETVQSIAADHTELSRLSTGGRALVEVAAMFEGTFSIDDLAAVLDEPVGKLLPAV